MLMMTKELIVMKETTMMMITRKTTLITRSQFVLNSEPHQSNKERRQKERKGVQVVLVPS